MNNRDNHLTLVTFLLSFLLLLFVALFDVLSEQISERNPGHQHDLFFNFHDVGNHGFQRFIIQGNFFKIFRVRRFLIIIRIIAWKQLSTMEINGDTECCFYCVFLFVQLMHMFFSVLQGQFVINAIDDVYSHMSVLRLICSICKI